MILGYVLVGWLTGLAVAVLAVSSGTTSWMGALALFVITGNAAIVILAGLVAARRILAEHRRQRRSLAAPVPPLPHRGSAGGSRF